jgi:hypothetical protein
MAGFEFCPSCSYRYTGFMPEFHPLHTVNNPPPATLPAAVEHLIDGAKDCPSGNPVPCSDSELLSELLAVIYGDGGHYQQDNGTEKATHDAIEKVFEMKSHLTPLAPGKKRAVEKSDEESKPAVSSG